MSPHLPHHIPGYCGHIPTLKHRNGGSFASMSRQVIQDPFVAQSPNPILAPPMTKRHSGGMDEGYRRNSGPSHPMPRMPQGADDSRRNSGPSPPMEDYRETGPPREMGPGPDDYMRNSAPAPRMDDYRQNSGPPPTTCTKNTGPDDYMRNPVGCQDIGCNDPAYCPPAPQRPKKQPCNEVHPTCGRLRRDLQPETGASSDGPEVLNRGPYSGQQGQGGEVGGSGGKLGGLLGNAPDQDIYRRCEGLPSSYAGHIPGFTFHSTGRTNGIATFGTKQYMQDCWYKNTFSRF